MSFLHFSSLESAPPRGVGRQLLSNNLWSSLSGRVFVLHLSRLMTSIYHIRCWDGWHVIIMVQYHALPSPVIGISQQPLIGIHFCSIQDQCNLGSLNSGNKLLQYRGNAGTHDLKLGSDTLKSLRDLRESGSKMGVPRCVYFVLAEECLQLLSTSALMYVAFCCDFVRTHKQRVRHWWMGCPGIPQIRQVRLLGTRWPGAREPVARHWGACGHCSVWGMDVGILSAPWWKGEEGPRWLVSKYPRVHKLLEGCRKSQPRLISSAPCPCAGREREPRPGGGQPLAPLV